MLRVLELVIETGPVHFKNAIRTHASLRCLPYCAKGARSLGLRHVAGFRRSGSLATGNWRSDGHGVDDRRGILHRRGTLLDGWKQRPARASTVGLFSASTTMVRIGGVAGSARIQQTTRPANLVHACAQVSRQGRGLVRGTPRFPGLV